jgi:tRNA1Val (adenine37-N6)-methyltransferase
VIIPFKEEENFLALAAAQELFPLQLTRVKGTPTSEMKRSLLAFSRNAIPNFPTDELIIENARHIYTQEYIALTKDFFLKM